MDRPGAIQDGAGRAPVGREEDGAEGQGSAPTLDQVYAAIMNQKVISFTSWLDDILVAVACATAEPSNRSVSRNRPSPHSNLRLVLGSNICHPFRLVH